MTNGRSSVIDSEANRSPSTFCTARATAMPPIPRPATSAVMSTPRLSSVSSNTSAQMTTFTMNPMMPSDPTAARSVVMLRRRFRSSHARRGSDSPDAGLPEQRDSDGGGDDALRRWALCEPLRADEQGERNEEQQRRATQNLHWYFEQLRFCRRRHSAVIATH